MNMLKVLHFTSESKKKFGVYKVLQELKKQGEKNFKVKLSFHLFDIFFFKPQIIHIHGCWQPKLFCAFLIAKLSFKKIVISPHGMLDPFSFAQKKIRKSIAWFLYQKYIFYFSNLIIVNSKFEKKNLLKKIKFKKRIEIIKHGVKIIKNINNTNNLKKTKKLKFVFFSRIHPSKNLIKLIEIWKNNNFFNAYDLDIYGEIEDAEYFFSIKNQISNLKNIKYKGQIKTKLNIILSKYDIFLHPSESENFGLVILEAISCGLIPIVNKKLDWRNLEKKGLCYSINFNNNDLRKLIIRLEKRKKKIRRNIFKKKLINYLIKNYDWLMINKEYFKCYLKLKP